MKSLLAYNPIATVIVLATLLWFGIRGLAYASMWWSARGVTRRQRWTKNYR